MNVTISPRQLCGTVAAISSKSCAHRLLICAALARGETVIRCRDLNQDIEATAQCLRAMGAEIDIATLTGAKKIVIREGTQPGEEFRLTGEGVADVRGGRKGDLIYRVVVEIPRKLSDKQRELLQQFDAISSDKDYRTRKGFFDALKNMFTGG